MSHPAYYGRPAMVARYRRRTAPASVHVVALFQYLAGLATLAAAVAITLVARAVARGMRVRLPDDVRQGLVGGGLVIAIALGVLGLLWLVLARKLQRGRPWARTTVLALSVLSIAGTGYDLWRGYRPGLLAGLVVPVLFIMLLSTPAARSWFRRGTW